MVNFKTFFTEGLGRYPKTTAPAGVEAALNEPRTPEEIAREERNRKIIDSYKSRRGDVYPDGKYNFQLIDGFRGMVANAWRALKKPGVESRHKPYSILVLGDPGVGKSEIMSDIAKRLCTAENRDVPSTLPDGTTVERKFVKWAALQPTEKKDVADNPEKYYVYMDVRTAYLTTAGLEGLPVPEEERPGKAQFYKALPPEFISFITQPDAAGFLFLDEVNQASREVQSILYQVVNDRVFKDVPISPRVLVVGAGNLGSDTTQPMGPALSRRFVGAVLVPDPDAWFEWAIANNFHEIIIDYIRSDPTGAESTFFKYPTSDGDAQQWPSPAALDRFNTQFTFSYDEHERLKRQDPEAARRFDFRRRVVAEAKGGLGPKWGEGFEQYLKEHSDIDLEKLAGDIESYKKTPEITKHATSSKLMREILREIDDAITSNNKNKKVGSPPLDTYEYDEAKLSTNLGKVVLPLMQNNSDDGNKKILQTLKAREPEYLLILLDYLVKDDVMFKKLTSLELSLIDKTI